MLMPALRTLDTRTARPPEKKADAALLTPENRCANNVSPPAAAKWGHLVEFRETAE
jgi:hypothetical protein